MCVDYFPYVLYKGAQVNAQNINGETALMKASLRGRSDVVGVLLEAGNLSIFFLCTFSHWLLFCSRRPMGTK